MLSGITDRIPQCMRYVFHNCVAHPLMELFYQLGLLDISQRIHDSTDPEE